MQSKLRSIFSQFLLSYLVLISLLFLSIGAVSYGSMLKVSEENLMGEGGQALSNIRGYLDGQFTSIYNISTLLYADDGVQRVRALRGSVPVPLYSGLLALSDDLKPYRMTNNFIHDITVYFEESQIFVSNDTVGIKGDVFYKEYLSDGSAGYHEWRKALPQRSGPSYSPFTARDGRRYLRVTQSLPSHSGGSPACVLVSVAQSSLEDSFRRYAQYPGAVCGITRTDGSLLFTDAPAGIDPAGALAGGEGGYIPFFADSEVVDLRYFLLVPREAVRYTATVLLGNWLVLYLLVLTASVAAAVGLAWKNASPIRKVAQRLEARRGRAAREGNELDYLEQVFSSMMHNEEQYMQRVRDNFFTNLLTGNDISPGEIEAVKQLGDDIFQYNFFTVILLRLSGAAGTASSSQYLEVSSRQMAALRFLSDAVPDGVYVHGLDYDKVALIVCSRQEEPRERIAAPAQDCLDGLAYALDGAVWGAAGDTKRMCDQIYSSCQNASWTLRQLDAPQPGRLYWYDDLFSGSEGYYLPDTVEVQFKSLIASCSLEKASALIDELYDRNFGQRTLSEQEKRSFTEAMIYHFTNLVRSAGRLSRERSDRIDYFMMHIRHDRTQEYAKRYFVLIAEILIQSMQENRSQKDLALQQEIEDAVRERFGDPGLGLGTLAERFGVSESYLSVFFKKQTGENLSAFIEKVRLEHSASLLLDTELPVKDVAEKAGYLNLNTFYKAFKRYFGVTPKNYRKSQ